MKPLVILSYDPTAFDIAFGEVMRITIIILAIVLHIFLIRYVYQDAKNRGDPNKIQWTFLVLLSSIFGILFYFYITKDLEFRVWLLSTIWMINAYIILITGGLFFFNLGPTAIRGYAGYLILIGFILPPTLFIIGSGACTLWISFQVTKDIFNSVEIRTSFILAVLGLSSFFLGLLNMLRLLPNVFPTAIPLQYILILIFFVLIIYIFYASAIRSKAKKNLS